MRTRVASIVVASVALAASAGACAGKARPSPTAPAAAPASATSSTMADPAAAADPAPPVATALGAAEFEASMRDTLAFVGDLGAAVTAAGADCPAVAAAIDRTVDRHAATIATMARFDQDPALRQRTEAWLEGHKPEVTAATAKIGAAIMPCVDDSAVQAAVEKLSPS